MAASSIWAFTDVADPGSSRAKVWDRSGKDYTSAAMSPGRQMDRCDRCQRHQALGPQRRVRSAGCSRARRCGSLRRVQPGQPVARIGRRGSDGAHLEHVTATSRQDSQGGHSAALSSASFSPDGTLIATSSADRTICVWSAASGIGRWHCSDWHGDAVNRVQFSADGKWLLSASDDGTVKLGQCRPCILTIAELLAMVPTIAVMQEAGEGLRAGIAKSTARFSLGSLFSTRRR